MTRTEFLKIWDTLERDGETRDYQPKDDDSFVKIGGYLFAVQESGNVIMKKCGYPTFSLRETFKAFRIWCKCSGIQYLRIEGSRKRYNFLSKMFPRVSIIKDLESEDRNIFFVKLYD
jgi:hypothetical protein